MVNTIYFFFFFFCHTICMYMKGNVNERLKTNTKKKSIKMWAVVFSLVLALEIILISSWELSIHSLLYAISIPLTNREKMLLFLKISCFFKDGSWYLKGEKLQMKLWNCKTHSYKCVHSCLSNTDMLINETTWFRICLLAARHWCI